MREVEGYIELMALGGERWPLSTANRATLGHRALEVLGKLDQTDSQRAHALLLSGLVYRAMEQYQEAIPFLEASARMDHESLQTWLALGWCHKRTGRVDLAIESMEQALDSHSAEAIVHYNLACYWALTGEVFKTIRSLSHAFELEPEYRERVAAETDFDRVRSHPDFQALLTSVIV